MTGFNVINNDSRIKSNTTNLRGGEEITTGEVRDEKRSRSFPDMKRHDG